MSTFEYILCHGSGNRFVMVDAVRNPAVAAVADLPALARSACALGGGVDGLLLTVAVGDDYGMRMFNPDGSEAEMCGNGIRCVARQVAERYLTQEQFVLWSGGRSYAISRELPVWGDIPTFGVEIAVRRMSADFVCGELVSEFVSGRVPQLDPSLEFTYLNLGNPHLVACVEQIDRELLERLGRRVLELPAIFPHGINISLFRRTVKNGIYVATYERGVGITYSCGTAMTASSTAACLLGVCDFGVPLTVSNRGGMVRCRCLNDAEGLHTQLVGNATYEALGQAELQGSVLQPVGVEVALPEEQQAYAAFLQAIAEN